MSSIEKAIGRMDGGSGEEGQRAAERPAEPKQPSAAPRKPAREHGPDVVRFNWAALRRHGLTTPEEDRQLAEEYRLIKRPLLANLARAESDADQHFNLVMVTSSLAGEGKTFTAFNLAMSVAMEMDHTVLLVDSDVAQGSLSRIFGLEGSPGLTDVLSEGMDPGEVIHSTTLEKFRVMPMGKGHPRGTELLGSVQMRNLADELARRYPDRIVIFDTTPLLGASQAPVLSSLMGQILLVVEAERTPQNLVQEALGLLEDDPNVGLVLNKGRRSARSGYYYYYGGYGKNNA
ncbi:MAG TPA: XrtA-associated tyrosine autokinase [Gammaproteobacteria bacterium]|nr:XrtA-associated tyrosine autokinase [Gammaproteobacteria bacterium]